jgi:hypothetical protein
MSGVIHHLPQYAFMAWCLVKAQGQLYLYLLLGGSEFHSVCMHFSPLPCVLHRAGYMHGNLYTVNWRASRRSMPSSHSTTSDLLLVRKPHGTQSPAEEDYIRAVSPPPQNLVTNPMEQYTAGRKIFHLLWEPKVHYIVQRRITSDPVLSQLNPIHTPTSYFAIRLGIILTALVSPEWSPLRFFC